jgi:hypothetical protein
MRLALRDLIIIPHPRPTSVTPHIHFEDDAAYEIVVERARGGFRAHWTCTDCQTSETIGPAFPSETEAVAKTSERLFIVHHVPVHTMRNFRSAC